MSLGALRKGETAPPGFRSGVHRECRTGAHARCVYRLTCDCACHKTQDAKIADASRGVGRDEGPLVAREAPRVPSSRPLPDCPGCGRQLNGSEDRCPECTPRSAP